MKFSLLMQLRRWGFARRATGIWLAAFLAFGPALSAATYHVNAATGDDSRTAAQATNPATPWQTITRALEEVGTPLTEGDVVQVAAGTYDEALGEEFPLELRSGVAITGADRATTFIESPAETPAFFNEDMDLLPTTTLSGFTLRSESAGSDEDLMVFLLGSSLMSPQILNNSFSGGGPDEDIGIYIEGESAGGSFNGLIDGNLFGDFSTGVDSPEGELGAITMAIYPELILLKNVGAQAEDDVISPTISNNTFSGNGVGVRAFESYYYYGSLDSYGTMAPVIDDNLFEDNEFDNLFTYSGLSVKDFSPTVSNNTSSGSQVSAIFTGYFGLFYEEGELRKQSATGRDKRRGVSPRGKDQWNAWKTRDVAARSFDLGARLRDRVSVMTAAGAGSFGSGRFQSKVEALDTNRRFGPTVSNNTITTASVAGILNFYQIFVPGDSLLIDMDISGNEVDESGTGILALLVSDDDVAPDTIVIQDNVVTDNAGGFIDGGGIFLGVLGSLFGPPSDAKTGALATTNDVRVSGNVITGNDGPGLILAALDYTTQPFIVSCNTITGNSEAGVVVYEQPDPNPDFGGGGFSEGNNNIFGNDTSAEGDPYDFFNEDADQVFAQNNFWGSTDPVAIDARIYDDDEDLDSGAVDFSGFLASAANCAATGDVDLAVSVNGTPNPVDEGENVTFTVTVTNNGPEAATGVVLENFLPTDQLVSATGCTVGNAQVTCAIGPLASGASVIRTIVITAPDEEFVLDSSSVSGNETDPNQANNVAVSSVVITAMEPPPPPATADLDLSKSASPTEVQPQGEVTYTLSVTNSGPDTATDVVITDTLPAGVTFQSASAGCTHASGVVTCNVGDLADGETAVRNVVVRAPSTPGSFTNNASVSSNETDPTPANNSSAGAASVQQAVVAVPTVGEWGLIILTMLLMATALFTMRRKDDYI